MLTNEIKEARRSGIGGSDVAAIAGISKWATPLDIYYDKIGIRRREETMSEAAFWGLEQEGLIARRYSQKTGRTVVKPDVMFRHHEHQFMIANLDGLIDDGKGILECKTAHAFKASQWGNENTDEIPQEYLLQCAHYGKVLESRGIEYVDLAVLIGGNDFRIYHYKRNKKLEENILTLESSFWNNHIINKVPPSPKTIEDVLSLFPKGLGGNTKTATQDMINAINKLKETRTTIKELEEKESIYKKQICESIADAEMIIDDEGSKLATWKNQEAARFDTTLFKKEHPDLYKEFCKTTETRVLRIA